MIPVECGDPAKEPASYTRFVLPFSYSPVKCSPQHEAPCVYKLSESASLWRKNYLTVETATVLFDRARWFELEAKHLPLDFQARRNGKNISIRIGSPRLVLFEWPRVPEERREDNQRDLLCIGFLIMEASFPKTTEAVDLDDLLEFNEKFRFWYQPYDGHEKYYRPFLAKCPLNLRQASRLVGDGNVSEIYFERWASLLDMPIEDERGERWWLFSKDWEQEARCWAAGDRKAWNSGWIVYADNRAFVWTCAIVKDGGKTLQRVFTPFSAQASAFGHWIKLLNVDRPGQNPQDTHKSTQFERAWAKERTYHRWKEFGTFYGFNYHCGAMLGPPEGDPPLWRHFGEMYFDQTLLLLYLRVGSFRFSRSLSRISAAAQDSVGSQGLERWQRQFESLRWSFALFTNLYEFPLLSNQQQSVEMYELARKYLDVQELFREIQEEIRSSHEYLEIQAGQEQTQITTLLTVVATLGLAAGLAIGFLGMNIVSVPAGSVGLSIQWRPFGIALVVSFLCIIPLVWCSGRIAKVFHKLANSRFFRDSEKRET